MRAAVLLLTHRTPWPPGKGDKVRSHRWLTALSRDFDVFLGTLGSSPEERGAAPELRKWAREVAIFPRPPRVRASVALLSGRSPSEEVFRSRTLVKWVARTLAEVRPAAAVAFSSTTAQYLDGAVVPKVLDLVDVDSAKWSTCGRRSPLRWLYGLEARRLAARERRSLRAFDRVTVISDAEAARLPEGSAVEVVQNGVDAVYFGVGEAEAEVPGRVVFTGAMDYGPNVEAVVWFARKVWPGIRNCVPTAEFTIVGSNPARAVRRLEGLPGVRVTGTVPDVRPWLHAAQVAVAPLLRAFGVQNKVLEAMAAGRAVVATAGAAEGIHARHGHDLLVAGGAENFGAAVVGLLLDREERRRLALAARLLVSRKYAWEPVMDRMRSVIREISS